MRCMPFAVTDATPYTYFMHTICMKYIEEKFFFINMVKDFLHLLLHHLSYALHNFSDKHATNFTRVI